jgi:hypothetical protein
LQSFGITYKTLSGSDATALAKDRSTMPADAAETMARKASPAERAPLAADPVLGLVNIDHRYETGAPFQGPAWTFEFTVTLPASSAGTAPKPSGARLLVTVDARTGNIMLVSGYEPR